MATITAAQVMCQVQHPWIIIVKESISDDAPEHRYREEATEAHINLLAQKLTAFAANRTSIQYVTDADGFLTDAPVPPLNGGNAGPPGSGDAVAEAAARPTFSSSVAEMAAPVPAKGGLRPTETARAKAGSSKIARSKSASGKKGRSRPASGRTTKKKK
jgi:hypothetical protein